MDSSELNKIMGAMIAALLVFMLLNFASGKIYGTRVTHSEDEPLAYAIEIEDDGAVEEEVVEEVDLVALVASADLGAGEKVFNKCKACHKVEDGANGVGPHLWDVVGRPIGGVDGYGYSDVLAGMDGAWTLDALSGFLEAPREWAPGTKMAFAGLSDPEDRVNLIVWLNETDGSPIPLE